MFSVYLVSYAAVNPVHRSQVLDAVVAGALLEAAMLPVFGFLSDWLGRRTVMIFGYVVCAAVVIPGVQWIASGDKLLVVLTYLIAMGVGHAAVYGSIAAYLVDMFPTAYRYSAFAVTYQLGATIASFGPLVAGSLAGGRHTATPGVVILVGTLAVASIGAFSGPAKDKSPSKLPS
jgi:MHS family shikimate/dehydroshikimate transporter-like MFS transporter